MKRIDLLKSGGFSSGDHLVASTVEEPVPSKDEVVVEIKASAVNPVDWKMAEIGFMMGDEKPVALGCDVAGIVTEGPLEGKRIVTYLGANKVPHPTDRGAYVQKVIQDASLVQEIPDSLSFAAAATLPVPGFTALLLLGKLNLVEGDFVLVWGASSGVGFNAVQLAAKRGLKPIAVASGKHKNKVMAIGAAAFVDYTKPNLKENVKEVVKDGLLKGAADCIGTADTFGTCCELVKDMGGGTGTVSTVTPMGLPDPPKGVEKKPVDFGTVLETPEGRAFVRKHFGELVTLQTLPVRSIKGGFTAETVQEAFQVSKKGVSGEKVVIEWTE